MYRIKTLNKISPAGLSVLDQTRYNISTDVENEDGILVRSADMHDYPFPDALRAIARAGAGTNNIPIDRCPEAGVVVVNTPGAHANAGKEPAGCGRPPPPPLRAPGFGSARRAPKNIQAVHGYRSGWSMKTRATWEFAHHYCGRLWKWFGGVSLPLSALAMARALLQNSAQSAPSERMPSGAQEEMDTPDTQTE